MTLPLPRRSPWEGENSSAPRNAGTEKYQCARCPRSFKRMEHLKRHRRSHDDGRAYVCHVCSKGFSRSDILHRHELGHKVTPSGLATSGRKRACRECARARERCTKDSPACLRCSTKSLHCSYPLELGAGPTTPQPQHSQPSLTDTPSLVPSQSPPEHLLHSHTTQAAAVGAENPLPSSTAVLMTGHAQGADSHLVPPNELSTPSYPHLSPQDNNMMDMMPTNLQPPYLINNLYSPTTYSVGATARFPLMEQQPSGFSESMDYPLNWLPANNSLDLDHTSILGVNISSYGLFMDLASSPLNGEVSFINSDSTNLLQQPSESNRASGFQVGLSSYINTSDNQPAANSQQTASFLSASISAPSPARTTTSSQSQSSASATAAARRTSMQGSLYATSSDGARVPCTVRSKRPHHRFTGATPIKSILDAHATLDDDDVNGNTGVGGFQFPSLDDIILDSSGTDFQHAVMTQAVYKTMVAYFQKLCLTQDNLLYPAFVTDTFPSIDHFNLFIRLYFENFDSILPIIHVEQRLHLGSFWPLALATGAIGCQYTDTEEFSLCVRPMHEFLRRILTLELELAVSNPLQLKRIPLMQALVLSQVGMLYSGSTGFVRQARARCSTLIELVNSLGLLSQRKNPAASASLLDGEEIIREKWNLWLTEETTRRLGYSVWLLDCMSAYHFGQRPSTFLEVTHCEVPHEDLWVCKSPGEWASAYRKHEGNPSLSSLVATLFLEKEVKKDLGEFARTLLLHGVYEEIFKVQGYLSRPLSSWTPSVQWRPISASATMVDNRDRLTASNDTPEEAEKQQTNLANWRNAALDCVDVLHWAANATIAGAAGVEHATVLHLHMARVVLLVPYESIQILARSIASLISTPSSSRRPEDRKMMVTREEAINAEQEVLRWAQRDEHKARLAVLHCGCFYWHIRRYSRDAFYEPISVFLATLTLWAYSSYASRAPLPSQNSQQQGQGRPHLANDSMDDGIRSGSVTRHATPDPVSTRLGTTGTIQYNGPTNSTTTAAAVYAGHLHNSIVGGASTNADAEDDNDREPTFIRLDRPNDDEMVQLFVRSGRPSVMRAYITGVGNICASPGAPGRILREGRKILGSTISSAWGRSREYTSILEAVERAACMNR
ncbi:hypothetical protein BX600DRAFT_64425 [Xylariales sp. PMI_506]|nr:hypothetical protein BX600DRAFT_64425 [Xylariales sp. PMI_506]